MINHTDTALRVGILGCSDVASRKFLPALLRSEQARLSAVASSDRKRAAAFAPCQTYASVTYDELIEGSDADLLYISLPNHLHEEYVLRALRGGKHVLCEKPLGLSVASVQRMLSAARERGLLLAENIMFLHHVQHRAAKDLVFDGRIGRLRRLRTSFGFLLRDSRNFRLDPGRGGGAFYDLIRYPLGAALLFLPGGLAQYSGIRLTRNQLNTGVHGHAVTGNGIVFDFSVSFDQQYESFYELIGEQGKLRLERAFTTPPGMANSLELTVGTERTTIPTPPDDHFLKMLDHAVSLINAEQGFEDEYAQALWLATEADRIWTSCENVVLLE
jgi:NDP-hexose-3-ketoreductase